MRKVFCLILAALLLAGCVPKNEKMKEPVTFYYCKQGITYTGSEDVISKEIREGSGLAGDLSSLLDLYLTGPVNDQLYSTIPQGTQVKAADLRNGICYLVLSESFNSLSGMDLTLACVCLTMTILNLTEADTVNISAESGLLDGKLSITITESDILMLDESLNSLDPE